MDQQWLNGWVLGVWPGSKCCCWRGGTPILWQESGKGTEKGAQPATGWSRLAGTSGGLLAHLQAQGCDMLCHPVGCYSELYWTLLCCKNHTLFFVFSPFFRVSDDIKVLSSGFSEEERKMSAFLNSKTTRSSRGTSSLFYCVEKNPPTLNLDVLWLVHLMTSRRALQLPFCRRQTEDTCTEGCSAALTLPSCTHSCPALSQHSLLLGGGALKIYKRVTVALSLVLF